MQRMLFALVVSVATLATGRAAAQAPADRRWRGGILLDEGFRGALRLHTVEDQEIARTISDLTLGATMLHAVAIDVALVPALRGDGELAWRAGTAYALGLGLTLAAGEIVKRAAGRARPYERECAADPERHGCDGGDDLFASFYSLHSGVSFDAAGFSCAVHGARSLYDEPAADAAACATTLALATATALLRVVADRHYLSDVVVGAVLGFAVGFLVPLAIVPDVGDGASGTPSGALPVELSIAGAF